MIRNPCVGPDICSTYGLQNLSPWTPTQGEQTRTDRLPTEARAKGGSISHWNAIFPSEADTSSLPDSLSNRIWAVNVHMER